MFLHDTGSFAHVFFNMFSVYMFGRTIESTWGAKRFLTFYMVTGIGAGIIQEITWFLALGSNMTEIAMYGDQLNNLITVGASGAVFGILLAFGMLFPNTPLFLMFIPIPIKAKYFVIFYGVTELFLGVSRFSGDNIAHFAHLGGMLFGFFMIRYWKNKDKQNGRFFY
jgi:membrane associated rhomboid family serine protease